MTWIANLRRSRFPLLALGSLLVLLSAGVFIAVSSERAARAQMAREAGGQADLLASAVSGALAFDDRETAQDYVNAVQVNPNVLAAAVYDEQNRIVASFARRGETIPPIATPRDRTTVFEDGRLYVVRPVEAGGQRLGTARLRLLDMPPSQRFSRYAGLLLILALAALTVIILAAAQGALRRANSELARRAAELADTIERLQEEMVEREKVEDALRQSQKMDAVGRLTGGIAHDFNNLLMVASSGVELLERTEDPAKRRKLSDGVRQAVDRGAALTRQLLAFSRRSPLKTEVLDLRGKLEGMRFLFERSLRQDIEVILDIDPALWRVEADAGELELALLNLAVNARDAMPTAGLLSIGARNDDAGRDGAQAVLITVADTGVGMSPETAARVFEPFFTTKEVGRGTGLGLSQVYGFCKSSGGDVSVVSRESHGTTFTLRLPRSLKDALPARPNSDAVEPQDRAQAAIRILLVEDDDAVAAAVGHLLRDLGHTYVRAARATEALARIEAGELFDLVFSDMVMPGEMTGLQLGEAIRANRSDLPILLTTGFSEAASAAGTAFPILLKPYGLASLKDAIAACIGAAR